MKTILSFMADDHDRLDNLFNEFRNIKNSDIAKAKELFREFKSGLERHIVWEEDILFPMFENKTGLSNTGPTAVMRMEHRKIKDYLEKIHNHIAIGNATINDLEDELIGTLSVHNNKEENILYPWIDDSVTQSEKEEALAKMEDSLPEKM